MSTISTEARAEFEIKQVLVLANNNTPVSSIAMTQGVSLGIDVNCMIEPFVERAGLQADIESKALTLNHSFSRNSESRKRRNSKRTPASATRRPRIARSYL
ncbi:MAG: hypothetical protein AAGG48_26045 [Planctomycetota bacterium]